MDLKVELAICQVISSTSTFVSVRFIESVLSHTSFIRPPRILDIHSAFQSFDQNTLQAAKLGFLFTGPDTRGGGGGTDSLSLGTNCETTVPPFWTKDSPYFATSTFTAPSFHGCQPPEINTE